MKVYIILILGILSLGMAKAQAPANTGSEKILVTEIIQTTSYTYVFGEVENEQQWLAMTKADVKEGKSYYFKGSMKMTNFYSKELDRKFDTIFFVEGLSNNPNHPIIGKGPTDASPNSSEVIKPVPGAITLADLFEHKKDYANKKVKIHGKVVKFSEDIMNTNWIHIQDGTSFGPDNDLIVTSNVTANVGDIITLEGEVVLDKDIGYGYFFEVLLSEATEIK